MGANCSGGALPQSSTKYLQLLKQSQSLSSQLCQKHNLPRDSQMIIKRIIESRQSHLLAALEILPSRNQKYLMLQRLEFVNLELLDSVYSLVNQLHYNLIQGRKKNSQINLIQPFKNISNLNQSQHDRYKQFGISALKNSEVAVILLAGGVSFEYQQTYKQLQPIKYLPSNKCLLELQLDRCQSIAELMEIKLQLIILLSQSKQQIKQFVLNKQYDNLKINFIQQYELGVLTKSGKVVMNSQKSFAMFPNGTGDFLSALNQQKILEKLKQNNIQYLSVCSVNNITQLVIDCVALGYLIKRKLDIVGKCITAQSQTSLSKIVSMDNKIYIADSRQMKAWISDHPQNIDMKTYNSAKVFTNNSIFKIDFLLSILSDQHWNYSNGRSYRKKQIIIDSFDPQLQIINKVNCFIFEKDFSDLFWFTKNFQIIQIQDDVYFPVISVNGKYSLQNSAKALSNQHKKWLKLKNTNSNEICEINAQISVWGQNLQQIIQQLRQSQIQYPLYIYNL